MVITLPFPGPTSAPGRGIELGDSQLHVCVDHLDGPQLEYDPSGPIDREVGEAEEMLRSLFGGKKRRRSTSLETPRVDESIGSARIGDVVVISGFSLDLEDAYVLTEKINRYESSLGKWYDLVGSDGDRPIAIEWSDDGGLNMFVSTQGSPMALSAVGLTNDELVRMDREQSLDNFVEYEGEQYSYSNSYEVFRFEDNRDEGEGFYLWEFFTADRDKTIAVVKWESMPFEVYASEALPAGLVSVFRK